MEVSHAYLRGQRQTVEFVFNHMNLRVKTKKKEEYTIYLYSDNTKVERTHLPF